MTKQEAKIIAFNIITDIAEFECGASMSRPQGEQDKINLEIVSIIDNMLQRSAKLNISFEKKQRKKLADSIILAQQKRSSPTAKNDTGSQNRIN